MHKFLYCVRFNELEKGDIFDFRTSPGVLYQVRDLSGVLVVYTALNDVFMASPICEHRIACGVVGLYEKKEVLNG